MSTIGLPIGYDLTETEKHNYYIFQLIAMVVEECKTKWGITGWEVYKKLKAGGIIEYLTDGYDCLHTQSIDYIVNDVEDLLAIHAKEAACVVER